MKPHNDCDTIFIDDSGFGSTHYIFTGIYIPRESADQANDMMDEWRESLLLRYGILTDYELHATTFVNNRGRPAGNDRPVYLPTRIKIYHECLRIVASIPKVRIFNTLSDRKVQMVAFGRLLNRLQVAATKRNSTVQVYCDAGKESDMDRLVRNIRLSNLTPSKFGNWGAGEYFKNINLDRVHERIVYLDSRVSHFIQSADFCAYAILRWKVEELPNRTRNNLHEAYREIEPVFERRAFTKDPHGIIRA